MKKLMLVFLVLIPIFAFGQQRIYLKNCLKLRLVYYADASTSMDTATSDAHKWAKSTMFIPVEEGYVRVGFSSFAWDYKEWCAPTGERQDLITAVDEFCKTPMRGATLPSLGLHILDSLFVEAKKVDSTEVQVLVIHSDYDWQDFIHSASQIRNLVYLHHVIVILSLPSIYDGKVDIFNNSLIDEEKLSALSEIGCISVRSNLSDFVKVLEGLSPIQTCN